MNDEVTLLSDFEDLLIKHKLERGILLVPIGDGTKCFRIGATPEDAARILIGVGEDIKDGRVTSRNYSDN